MFVFAEHQQNSSCTAIQWIALNLKDIHWLAILNPLLVKMKVKAMRVGNSIRVAIPSEVCQASGIKVGDTLMIDYDERQNRVTLEKEK